MLSSSRTTVYYDKKNKNSMHRLRFFLIFTETHVTVIATAIQISNIIVGLDYSKLQTLQDVMGDHRSF